MSRGAVLDTEGRIASEDEVAKSLGFYNIRAFHLWKQFRDKYDQEEVLDDLMAHVANLIEEVRDLREFKKSAIQARGRN